MKYTLIICLFFTATFFVACHKEKKPAESPDLAGMYFGKTNSKSTAMLLEFTSPWSYQYVAWADSVSNKPDTLIVTNISADSFAISGSVVLSVPTQWRTFGTAESTGSSGVSVERHISLSGYFYTDLVLTFDPTDKAVSLHYATENTQSLSSFNLQFSGAQ